jgi:hypothetical protein
MTDAELARCFFPQTRKEIIIETLALLQTRAGENRIKLGLMMPLSDGKLVGMPSWIGDSLDIIGREDSLESAVKFDVNLKEMTLTIFGTEDSQKPAQLAVAPLLNAFQLRRDPQEDEDEELSDVNLHFVAYIGATTVLWSWFYTHFRKSIFTKFETTQADLPLEQPDTQMKLGDDGYEAARKDATGKERDVEFAGKAN